MVIGFTNISEKRIPSRMVVYAINKESVDYEKIKNLGEVIQYGSIKHWAYYLAVR